MSFPREVPEGGKRESTLPVVGFLLQFTPAKAGAGMTPKWMPPLTDALQNIMYLSRKFKAAQMIRREGGEIGTRASLRS